MTGKEKGRSHLGSAPEKYQFASANDSLVTVATAAETAAITTTAAAATAAAAAEAATLTAETAAAAAAEAAGRAIFLGTGFVDLEGATTEFDAVRLLDGNFGLIGRAHGYEGEAARAAREFVHRHINVGHGTELFKVGAEFGLRGLERHVADVEFGIAHLVGVVRATVRCQSVPTVGFEIIT